MQDLAPGRDIALGRYSLVAHCRLNARWYSASFATLEELARAAFGHSRSWYPLPAGAGAFGARESDIRKQFDTARAFGPRGGELDHDALLALGARLRATGTWTERWFLKTWGACSYVRRDGPVPGVHKSGHYRQFRSLTTTPERRLGALVLREDGEVAPRAARGPHTLPNSWDDYSRARQRSWKAQGKGRKAWDR